MKYYFSKTIKDKSFEEVKDKVTEELKKEGFGVLTHIDVKETLKKKIDVDFRRYEILGACNPHFAHKALSTEEKIGLMLPCNVVVEENKDGFIDVSAVDPIASMGAVANKNLESIAKEVTEKLQRVINGVN